MGCASSRQTPGPPGGGSQAATAGHSPGGAGAPPLVARGKRITKGPGWKYGNVVTQQQLVDMRSEFFATRVEGNSYIWQVIKAASEALLEGDEELCNSIMEASAVMCPSGVMTLCYDDTGFEYRVPKYCFSNPEDMRSTMDEARALQGGAPSVLEPGEAIIVKMQVAPAERKFDVEASSNMTVGLLKEKLCNHIKELRAENSSAGGGEPASPRAAAAAAAAALPTEVTPHNQRIIYCGKELPDGKTLAELGVSPEFVLQVYVRKKVLA